MEDPKKKKQAYNNQRNKAAYDRMTIMPKKEDRFPERIDAAVAQGLAPSRQAYIIQSVKDRLDSDNIV